MRRGNLVTGIGMLCLLALSACAVKQPTPGARADFKSADGVDRGSAVLFQEKEGVLIRTSAKGLTAGEHGYHIHAVGKCDSPFESAGAHFNPSMRKHGRLNPDGAHSGDLPNLSAKADGEASSETFVRGLTLTSLFDSDSASLIIHAARDNYVTDPSGNSGARLICGVIRRP